MPFDMNCPDCEVYLFKGTPVCTKHMPHGPIPRMLLPVEAREKLAAMHLAEQGKLSMLGRERALKYAMEPREE